MNDKLFAVPSSAGEYERLGREIDDMRPSITADSTGLYAFNRLLIERRRLWMRINGLGPR